VIRYRPNSIERDTSDCGLGPEFETKDAALLFMYLYPRQFFEHEPGVYASRSIKEQP
jgi:hypothetical protein